MRLNFTVLTLLIMLVSAPITYAENPNCLRDATDRQILTELQRRLNNGNGGGGETGGVIISFICGNNATFSATGTVLSSSENTSYETATGNWTNCRNVVNFLNDAIGNTRLHRDVIFAVCAENAVLKKIQVSPTRGLIEVSSTSTGNWSECRAAEDQVNRNITP